MQQSFRYKVKYSVDDTECKWNREAVMNKIRGRYKQLIIDNEIENGLYIWREIKK